MQPVPAVFGIGVPYIHTLNFHKRNFLDYFRDRTLQYLAVLTGKTFFIQKLHTGYVPLHTF